MTLKNNSNNFSQFTLASKIGLFNPAIVSSNLGDNIISSYVKIQLKDIFKHSFIWEFQTQDKISWSSYYLSRLATFRFLGGSNILNSNMFKRSQWKVGFFDATFLKPIVLFGVGWWQYEGKPTLYTKVLLKQLLHKNLLHSVRDNFTKKQLFSIGIKNTVCTACPTMWKLTKDHCLKITRTKGEDVVFTLTDYRKDPAGDAEFINTLQTQYSSVFFWPQGEGDLNYLQDIMPLEHIKIISPTLEAYDVFLHNHKSVDFVGTRLHGGIKALNEFKRSIIIGIDNRAKEKAKDFGLKVIPRNNIEQLNQAINSSWDTTINLPLEEIKLWKKQFTNLPKRIDADLRTRISRRMRNFRIL